MNNSFNRDRFLSFSLGAEEYAIPLLSVKEVIAMPEVTKVPSTPTYFLGIMNLRGQVISVMDLRTKIGINTTKGAETAVIICDLGSLNIGVVVDSVNRVLSPNPEELSQKPDIESSSAAKFVTGVYRNEDKLVLLLDIAKTLNVEDHVAVSKGQNQNQKAA